MTIPTPAERERNFIRAQIWGLWQHPKSFTYIAYESKLPIHHATKVEIKGTPEEVFSQLIAINGQLTDLLGKKAVA